ncbi:hypothetical protein QM012_000762 [Aureobasidium pullulans]|uniref:NAD(P)-binding protein n=1 Tax=Aureobasidium pullulans TaxID=5580 RepID=A0ABR0TX73_AURPU
MAKSVLITGCSSGGIGAALAHRFQRSSDYTVFVTAREVSKIDAGLRDCDNVHVIPLDVTSHMQIQAAVAEVASRTGGRLDILINNAGLNYTTPVLDTDIVRAEALFKTNVWGPVLLTQSFAPLLLKAGGTVANVSSIAGVLNTPYMGIYGASKTALTLLSETLRLEMEPLGVKVLTIVAGNVHTQFWTGEKEVSLPSGSKYEAILQTINDAATGKLSGDRHTPASQFSDQLFTAIDKGQSGVVWQGALAGSVRWITKFMPQWALDKALSNGRGLDKLR